MSSILPFDDRRALDVPVEQVSMALVRRHLQNLGSGLAGDSDDREVLRRMRITVPVNGHESPRNVALLMFTEDPERWFPGARIEVAQFAGDARGNLIEERTFRGPLAGQVRECVGYLQSLSTAHFQKVPDHAQTRGWVSYPLPALEESIVNAVYHRSYEGTLEPVKVYLYPDRMQIVSYPGPVPGIELQHLEPGGRVPPVPARNRRIGEFLKELRLAESRGTGIPKVFDSMAKNGSPTPRYEFAQTKIRLSHPSRHHGRRGNGYARAARRLLLREAKEMLQRVIQLDAGSQRHAWAWYDLGRVCRWLGEPAENSRQAFDKARELAPNEDKLLDLLDRQEDTGQ